MPLRDYLRRAYKHARKRAIRPKPSYTNSHDSYERAYWSGQELASSSDEEWEDETVELSPPVSYYPRSHETSSPRVGHRRSPRASETRPGRGLRSVDEEWESHTEEPRPPPRYDSRRGRRTSPPKVRQGTLASCSGIRAHGSAHSDCSSDVTGFSGFHRYTPIKDDEIRLLRLEPARSESDDMCCSSLTASQNQAPAYEALSYEWGSAERQKHIIMDGRKVRVRRNLWVALRALRVDANRHPRILWVDALCINQCDNVEKFQQVAQMGPIYRRARRAICWLGNASVDSDLAINFVQKAAQFVKDRTRELGHRTLAARELANWISANDYFDSEAAAKRLLQQRSYWKRMWIRQEIILAQEVTIYCGHSKLNWSEAEVACRALRTWYNESLRSGGERHSVMYHNVTRLYKSRENLGLPKSPQWLLNALIISRESRATDPKDKVFGLLGIFQHNPPPDSYRLWPNYGLSFFDVCLETFKYCVFAEDQTPRGSRCLDILCASRPEYSGSSPHHFPSWLADWSASQEWIPIFFSKGVRHREIPRASLDKAPKVTLHPDGQRLRCKGLSIGRVQQVGSPVDILGSERSRLATLRDWCNIAWGAQKGKADWDGFLRTLFFDAYVDPPPKLHDHLENWRCDPNNRLSKNIYEEIKKILGNQLRRKFVFAVSNHGEFLGIPQEALPDDVICIIYGCTVPVVLRPQEDDTYTCVGDCYVDGLMYGEAIKRYERGYYHSQTFELK